MGAATTAGIAASNPDCNIAHALLPIADKGGSDWGYAWVPVVGPLPGGALGAWIYRLLWPA